MSTGVRGDESRLVPFSRVTVDPRSIDCARVGAVDAASGAVRARSRRGVTFPSPSRAFFAALALRRVIGGEEVPSATGMRGPRSSRIARRARVGSGPGGPEGRVDGRKRVG